MGQFKGDRANDKPFANTGGIYYLELVGAVNKPNITTAIFFSIAVPLQLYASYKLIQYIIKNEPQEKALILWVVLTFVLLLNEFNIILKVHAWAMPMLFLTYTVESIRLSASLQAKYQRKLSDLEHDLTRISQVAEIAFTAGAICHDIRNPLGIAAGNSTRIKKMIKHDAVDLEKLGKIQEGLGSSLDRIAKIIDEYMALMRNELIDNYDRHQLKELFNRAVELSMPKITKYGNIKIEVEVPDILYVECLENQIVLSIVNLISNSCDAIQSDKNRWIQLKGSFIDKNKIKIMIVDSGLGISEAAVDRIFESQFTTKKKGEGTGLGLDIVKRFIEKHSGQIYVDKFAQNTTFVITLPIKHKETIRPSSNEAA
ncbi:MAG: sensor histidine kinase [Oligoflexales bacterium]